MKKELQFSQVLKRELKSKGLTINALARRCDMPVSVLHAWIQGVRPSAKNLHYVASLSESLNLPVSVLLFDQTDRGTDSSILFDAEFVDGGRRYRLLVEKMRERDDEP